MSQGRSQPVGYLQDVNFATYGNELTTGAASTAATQITILGDLSDYTGKTRLITDYFRFWASGGNTTTTAFEFYLGYVNALSTSGISIKSIYKGDGGMLANTTIQDNVIMWPTSIPDDSARSVFAGQGIFSTTAASTGSAITRAAGSTATLAVGDLISILVASGSALNINYNITAGFRAE